MPSKLLIAASVVAAASLAQAGGSLADIKHVVIFMQENRAFDHYFGTMAGVRGFADPNVQYSKRGYSSFQQFFNQTTNGVNILQPFHLNYLGGSWNEATQCMIGGSNSWSAMQGAYNFGEGNNWIGWDHGKSMGYFKREDVPTHWDIVEGWTVLDMNSQSVLAATDPNRIMWVSGSINAPGSPTNLDGTGGMVIDNPDGQTEGCHGRYYQDGPLLSCYPFTWKTFPEYLEDAGVSWQVWQDLDNFEDNMLAYFKQYKTNDTPLQKKGNSYPGLDAFYAAAAAGTLPEISYIVGPQELAEHPPNMPKDGAWLQKQVVDAVTNSPLYNQTALIISYDEQGGWYDHVIPQVSENGTAGEWIEDPYNQGGGRIPIGPGPRVPRYIISPWTRGGHVFTQPSDHNSDQFFVERWAAAHGYHVHNEGITQWRRDHMSDLVDAFDFDNPDYSIPHIADVPKPPTRPNQGSNPWGIGSLDGPWVGPGTCTSNHGTDGPPAPYGADNANQDLSKLVESGFKQIRGRLTEGRYLTFESGGTALAALDDKTLGLTPATQNHDDRSQRWIVHSIDNGVYGNQFQIQSVANGNYIASANTLTSDVSKAQTFTITYNANGATYQLAQSNTASSFLQIKATKDGSSKAGSKVTKFAKNGAQFKIFSVSYQ